MIGLELLDFFVIPPSVYDIDSLRGARWDFPHSPASGSCLPTVVDGNRASWLGFQIVALGDVKGGGIGGRLQGSCVACEGLVMDATFEKGGSTVACCALVLEHDCPLR